MVEPAYDGNYNCCELTIIVGYLANKLRDPTFQILADDNITGYYWPQVTSNEYRIITQNETDYIYMVGTSSLTGASQTVR
jgi:hypothetical protein